MFTKPKPNYWLLLGIVPLMVALLVVQAHLSAGAGVHELLEISIVALGFGLMWLWVRANQSALASEDDRGGQFRVVYDSTLDEPVQDEHGPFLLDELDEWDPASAPSRLEK